MQVIVVFWDGDMLTVHAHVAGQGARCVPCSFMQIGVCHSAAVGDAVDAVGD